MFSLQRLRHSRTIDIPAPTRLKPKPHVPAPRPALAAEIQAPYGDAVRRPKSAGASVKPASPFLKWAGGKTQLLPAFERFYPAPETINRFIEPFLGGGSVFFHVRKLLQPKRVWLFDRNADLINTYAALQSNVEAVIALLQKHRTSHSEEHYYKVRAQNCERLSPAARAARFIYLNKTCYNGLYRVNSQNQFNVPMGRYVRPSIFDADHLRRVALCLKGVRLATQEFAHVLKVAKPDDFVYFDPPYDPLSPSASFTGYTANSFNRDDQSRLATVFADLDNRGCKVMLSNSDTPFVRQLYRQYSIHKLAARRAINTRADLRGPVWEVVVLNYRPPTGQSD